jgi:nicotinamidase/pyrazinamidase
MNKALIVVDIQNDFCEGGALAVPRASEIIPRINELMIHGGYDVIVLTQDWHHEDHYSFKELWPPHCRQGTLGAAFHPLLNTSLASVIVRKGMASDVDSYSAFLDNDGKIRTGLNGYLKERFVRKVDIVGLALDYCVKFTAKDAQQFGYEVTILTDCCRAIDPDVDATTWGVTLKQEDN